MTIWYLDEQGPVPSVSAKLEGPLAVSLSWEKPVDLGPGQGVEYPLLAFEYGIFLDSGISQLLGSAVLSPTASSATIRGLEKGKVYYISVRARNDAMDADGYGDWFNYSLLCTSFGSKERPSTCGVLALDFPTPPLLPRVESSGTAGLLSTWQPPSDTGEGSSQPRTTYEVQYGFEVSDGSIEYLPIDEAGALLHHIKTPLIIGRVYVVRCRYCCLNLTSVCKSVRCIF